jgi:hypothetical protein
MSRETITPEITDENNELIASSGRSDCPVWSPSDVISVPIQLRHTNFLRVKVCDFARCQGNNDREGNLYYKKYVIY